MSSVDQEPNALPADLAPLSPAQGEVSVVLSVHHWMVENLFIAADTPADKKTLNDALARLGRQVDRMSVIHAVQGGMTIDHSATGTVTIESLTEAVRKAQSDRR